MINSDGKSRPALPDPEGVRTDLVELRLRAFARTPYDRVFTDLATIDAAEAALHAGCDALYVDTFADYGLDAIRTVAEVPVVGAGEASLAAAAARGRYSVLTVWPPSMRYLYAERLRACAGGERCGGVHHFSPEAELDRAGTRDGVKARMTRTEEHLVEELARACRQVVREDGTDLVLLGCTCMSPVAELLQERCDVEVLDPSRLGQQAAFAALLEGRRADPLPATTRAGQVSTLVDAWLPAAPDEPTDDCDVCVVADQTETE